MWGPLGAELPVLSYIVLPITQIHPKGDRRISEVIEF